MKRTLVHPLALLTHQAGVTLIILAALSVYLPRVSAQNTIVTCQGRVQSGGGDFNGTGQFKFALVTTTNANSQATATATVSGGFVTMYTVTFPGIAPVGGVREVLGRWGDRHGRHAGITRTWVESIDRGNDAAADAGDGRRARSAAARNPQGRRRSITAVMLASARSPNRTVNKPLLTHRYSPSCSCNQTSSCGFGSTMACTVLPC